MSTIFIRKLSFKFSYCNLVQSIVVVVVVVNVARAQNRPHANNHGSHGRENREGSTGVRGENGERNGWDEAQAMTGLICNRTVIEEVGNSSNCVEATKASGGRLFTDAMEIVKQKRGIAGP